MVERILVGVDGSENSLEALREAVTLAELIHSDIIVVNVQRSLNHLLRTKAALFINKEMIKEYQKELFDIVTRSAIEYIQTHKVEYELKLLFGDPGQQICRLADELAVRYIVLGSRGIGVVKGTIFGSVSNAVLHNTKIPILIIPQKK